MTPAFEKLMEITSSRATWVNTNKMKQQPAFKRTWCVQGATESLCRQKTGERAKESREMPQGCWRGLRGCPASTGSHGRTVFTRQMCF